MTKKIRIGNSSGFWGDEPLAMRRQVSLGNLDYLVADYLAELSMSILYKQMQKRLDLGYVPDFIEHVKLAGDALKKDFPKIITNAGGKNPLGCAEALCEVLRELGLSKKILVVMGDDLMSELGNYAKKNDFFNLESRAPFEMISSSAVVANAYTSSEGIVRALAAGADIVITGRASDSALTIGPLIHEFGWQSDDWDKIAAGMVAGHVLECGTQASGGNFTDWEQVASWDEMGYPIVEVAPNGDFEVTKPEGTGGLVNQWTVKEQLIYEVADPMRYMGPDVVANISEAVVEDIATNRVSVTNIKGSPAPESWKVSMAFTDGYKAVGSLLVGGEQAAKKAHIIAEAFWKRFDFSFNKQNSSLLGASALGEALSVDSNEVLLQLTAFDYDKSKLEVFSKEIAGMILAGPQGLAAFGGRPRIQTVVSYWPTLVSKVDLDMVVYELGPAGERKIVESFTPAAYSETFKMPDEEPTLSNPSLDITKPKAGMRAVKLKELCLARSGDKGNTANIGVLARSREIYDYLVVNMVPAVIKSWFEDLCQGEVRRYKVDSLMTLNFMLYEVLDGGGTRSARVDPQGKMLAAALLAQTIYVPEELLKTIKH